MSGDVVVVLHGLARTQRSVAGLKSGASCVPWGVTELPST